MFGIDTAATHANHANLILKNLDEVEQQLEADILASQVLIETVTQLTEEQISITEAETA